MYKYVDGVKIEMTPEEIEEWETSSAAFKQNLQLYERTRPLTESEVTRMLINTLSVEDNLALRMKEFYPRWEDMIGKTVDQKDFKFTYGQDLYKTIPSSHTFSAEWVPGVGTESLYTRIDETHDGTLNDPIPYNGNMELFENLYYVQDYVLYRCTRNTQQPVYNNLSELVGIYVELVN